MSGMVKMWISFAAMGMMIVASLLITFARLKTKGIVRIILSLVAFLLLLFSIPYMLVSML